MKMKHYLKLVPISAKIHRKQSKMTRICITLAVFLSAVIFGLADMYLQGLTQKQMQENGNIPLLSIEGQLEGETGINQIYQIALILSIVVMLTCVLIISSSLNSNVTQRTEFFGMIRCLGATKKQIMGYVHCEGFYWCSMAIPIGLVISVLIVWILSAAMRAISPQWFSCMPHFGVSWVSIAASTLLGLFTVLLAARSPAKLAAKVSPLTAVSGNAGQRPSFHKSANTRLLKIETALGIHHARARKRNYIFMTGAFAICITLFLTFSTLVDFMENAFLPPAWTPELSIASGTNTLSIDRKLLKQVNQNSAVKRAYGRMFVYDVSAKNNQENYNANVISYEENQFRWAADSLVSGSIKTVMEEENQVLFVQTENTDVQIGDSITLRIHNKEQIVTVAGILSNSPFSRVEGTETIFCSEKTLTALTGQTGYTVIDVQFKNGASSDNVKEVESIFSEGSVVFSAQFPQVRQQKKLYYAFSVLAYGFLSIIVAITIFHIINTVSLGVTTRMKEYGTMRAIGMANRQLVDMIVAEVGTYAASGVILGCIIGLPMHWVVFVSMITNFWGTPWNIPFIPLGLILIIVVSTSFLAVHGPAKRLQRMSVAENIIDHIH